MNKVNQHTITTATTTLHSPTGLRTVSGPPLDFQVRDPDAKLQFAACLYITNHCCGLGRRRRNFKDAASLYGSLDILLMSGYVRAYACVRACACETVSSAAPLTAVKTLMNHGKRDAPASYCHSLPKCFSTLCNGLRRRDQTSQADMKTCETLSSQSAEHQKHFQ